MAKNSIQTSIIVPAYNEEPIIADTLTKIFNFYQENLETFGATELIIVAAGDDDTAQIAKTFKDKFTRLKVIEPKSRVGKGRDVRLGFKAAEGEVQIFLDADLATPVHHLKKTIELLRDGNDMVIGARKLSKIHTGRIRTIFSLLSNLVTRSLFSLKIKDTQCGYKGLTKEAAKKAFKRQRLNGWGFDIELIQLARENKLKIFQQPIDDWSEAREDEVDLRGDGFLLAYAKTFADVILLRIEAWGRFANRHYKSILILSMIGIFALSLHIGLRQSVWFDEGYSITLAKRPISELLQLTSVDAHPPLYYLVLKGWATVFGYSEFALRALSAIFASLSLGAMYLLIRKVFRPSSAVISLPFLIISPFLMRYSFEIRMYSMVMLICILATYVLVKAKESQKMRHWLLYSALVALGLYSLYMSIVVWLAHGVYLLSSNIRDIKNSKVRLPLIPTILKQKYWIAYGLSALIFLPYLPTLISQFSNSALPRITSPVTFEELTRILSFGVSYEPEWQLSVILSLLLISFLVLLIKLISHNYSKALKREKNGLNLFLSIFLVPILFFALISIPPLKPYFMERYLAHFIIFGYALIGITLDSAWRNGKHLSSIILTFLSLGLLISGMTNLYKTGNYNFQSLNKPNAKLVRENIADCSGATVVAEDPFAYIDSSYYYQDCDLRFFSKDELGPYGGYVPLRFSNDRVSSPDQISAFTVYHLHWEKTPDFRIKDDPRYKLVSTTRFDKHFVDKYQLVNQY